MGLQFETYVDVPNVMKLQPANVPFLLLEILFLSFSFFVQSECSWFWKSVHDFAFSYFHFCAVLFVPAGRNHSIFCRWIHSLYCIWSMLFQFHWLWDLATWYTDSRCIANSDNEFRLNFVAIMWYVTAFLYYKLPWFQILCFFKHFAIVLLFTKS